MPFNILTGRFQHSKSNVVTQYEHKRIPKMKVYEVRKKCVEKRTLIRTHSLMYRRQVHGITAGLLAHLLLRGKLAHAYIINEIRAQTVFESAEASVVAITINQKQTGEIVEDAVGSGIIWDAEGYIVTNYHCVQPILSDQNKKEFLHVRLGSDSEHSQSWEPEIVGVDPQHDLAVLKVKSSNQPFQPIKVGTSGDLKVGQSVFAIGNSYGYTRSLSAGVVSGLNRGIPTPGGAIATRAIQTDAAIYSGNSGGALLDSSGRLIGISTSTFTSNKSQGRGSGVNFAISVDVVREVVPKLILQSRRKM